jgi:hypothetical protein
VFTESSVQKLYSSENDSRLASGQSRRRPFARISDITFCSLKMRLWNFGEPAEFEASSSSAPRAQLHCC